jgi:hypothetical protein
MSADLANIHAVGRTLPGFVVGFTLPLCWDMYGRERGATDDEWWISVDHGAIEPDELIFAQRPLVTCPACLEWVHA